MVGDEGELAMSLPWNLLGKPRAGGLLIVGDHASNHVPGDIALGISADHLKDHIAWDIGVAAVAELMVASIDCAAYLGNASRLVVDLNRYPEDHGVLPHFSDGIEITGNVLTPDDREARLSAWYHPYHDRLSELLAETRPLLILSLHSFTPGLKSRPEEARPWEVGVLYNEYEAASKLAIAHLEGAGLIVGDQLPYSGKLLNATMNRHAEANGIPYVGIEMRQDLVSERAGQERFAQILANMCKEVAKGLGEAA